MEEKPVSRSRLADDILASLTRMEDRINRTQRSVSLITWSLATAAVLQIGAVAAALIILHQSFSSSLRDTNSGLTGDMEKMMQQLYGLEQKVESRPGVVSPSSSGSTDSIRELMNSPELRNLLQQQSQFMKENWGILEGHKPSERSP